MPVPRRTAKPDLIISLHAATRVAQHHGRTIDEPALAASVMLRGRYERALLRLLRRSEYVAQTEDGSGVLTNATRTRAIVVRRGVVVTVIACKSKRGFGVQKLLRMAARLKVVANKSPAPANSWP